MHFVKVTLRNREGALLRLLALVERRGYPVRGLTFRAHRDRDPVEVDLEVAPSPERTIENLQRQMEKLVDVVAVRTGQEAAR